jgi:hypothetical protein
MRSKLSSANGRVLLAAVTIFVGYLSVLDPPAAAQGGTQGQDAVYPSSGNCCVGTGSFVDASKFVSTNNPNICAAVYSILSSKSYPAAGTVVDARGISGAAALTCGAGTSPWTNGTTPVSVASTILLPAGTIVIPSSWILPSNTHLIGEGDGIPSSGSSPGTTIQALANNFTGNMIQFATSTACSPPQGGPSLCSGISVERLTLDGQGQAINGVINQYVGDVSYVDHVSLYQITGTGLLVSGGLASNSGPYSSITFDTGSSVVPTSTVCAQILAATGTVLPTGSALLVDQL